MTLSKEKFTTFHIVKAPIEQVLPLCVGLVRVSDRGAVLTHDVTDPPLVYDKAMYGRDDYFDFTAGTLVSTPKGQPHLTLIECPPLGSYQYGLAKLAPALEMLTIYSKIENQKMQQHGFELHRGADRLRFAEIEKGWEQSGWAWREEGALLTFEDATSYAQRSIPKRITRTLLGEYAAAYGVDPTHHLIERNLTDSVLITSGHVMKPKDHRPRTDFGQEAYEKALALGIGEPEPTAAEHAMDLRMREEAEQHWVLLNKANNAMNRLRKKDDPPVEKVVAIYERYHASLVAAFGEYASPQQVLNSAASMATGIDPMHPGSQRLRYEKARWDVTIDFSVRLAPLVPDVSFTLWPDERDLHRMVSEVLEAPNLSKSEVEAEVLNRFSDHCTALGGPIAPDAELDPTFCAIPKAYEVFKRTPKPIGMQIPLAPDTSGPQDLSAAALAFAAKFKD